jgi:hypothetical protein
MRSAAAACISAAGGVGGGIENEIMAKKSSIMKSISGISGMKAKAAAKSGNGGAVVKAEKRHRRRVSKMACIGEMAAWRQQQRNWREEMAIIWREK